MAEFFETESIYFVDPNCKCLDARNGDLTLVNPNVPAKQLEQPFWVTGVRRHDLAAFASAIDAEGVLGFLVVETLKGQGLLVTDDYVRSFPEYQTPELAEKIATLPDHELSQLGIDGVVAMMRRRYPNIKGLTR